MTIRENIRTKLGVIKHHISNRHLWIPLLLVLACSSFGLGFLAGSSYPKVLGKQTAQVLPVVPPDPTPEQPLRKYSIQNLGSYPYQLSEINLERVLEKNADFTSYLFSYRTLGKKMTGQLNVPNGSPETVYPVIVLIRGYVDIEEYKTGMGTAPVAAEYARHGYVTLAPDFLGFGESEPSGPGWEERFEKPVNVIELIKSLRQHTQLEFKKAFFKIDPQKLGIWAHSNGGQITLTTLEALGEPIPTSVWAPVTAPFPYSVLYYSDEMDDGGKGMRSAVAGFESVYNVQEYSLTQHIDRLRGPIQLHQGTLDDAVPQKWSDEFVKKVKEENDRRQAEQQRLTEAYAQQEAARKAALAASASALPSPILAVTPTPATSATTAAAATVQPSSAVTTSASAETSFILADLPPGNVADVNTSIKVRDVFLEPIDLSYFVYKGGNHFIRPGWEEAVARDLSFFDRHVLGK